MISLYALAIGYVVWSVRTRTNLDGYDNYLAAWSPHLVSHFPTTIEKVRKSATAVSYFPGYLQAGAHLQLRMRVSKDIALREKSAYSKRAIHVINDASATTDAEITNPPPEPLDYLVSPDVPERFPDHYTSYYLLAKPGTTDEFPWNHGQMAGVSISVDPPELVYWAEVW